MSISYNHYITSEDLDTGYLDCLQSRIIKPQYRFTGKAQAQSWVDIWDDANSPYFNNLYTFINQIKEDITKHIKTDVNFIALGGSNGVKNKPILEELLKKRKTTFSIIASSKDLMNHSLEKISDINIPKEVFISHFKSKNLKLLSRQIKENHHDTNFFVMLSNTFGLHPQETISKSLRDAMNKNDYLLIEAHIAPDKIDPNYIEAMLNNYKNSSFKKHVLLSLSQINITEDDGFLELEYSNDKFFTDLSVVSYYFRFKKSKVVKYLNEEIYFAKNERILLFSSNKYKVKVLRRILNDHGFDIKEEFINHELGCAEILCQLA
ncbi:MAG: Unknown protein [uncultured Campylobacterales bacterium]|uniref:Histidine-specific methyltransferase SAM-dependent domain-containing protein n=1 Tax=uncultured Campylobacterales bacterium TaxID=352960 RepID=A0A6S6SFF7_9BACT|nr:MAG: Unknown protein [uncultured Campylobacterales bacterium]